MFIIGKLFDKSRLMQQINILLINNIINNKLHIKKIGGSKLTDKILLNYPKLKILNLAYNYNVTNDGISHLQLYSLNLCGNGKITDEGICNMQLRILNLKLNNKITDDGIRHMQLYVLNLCYNNKITND